VAAFEAGAGPHQREEMGCVDRAPAGLCGLDQLEDHAQGGRPAASALGDLRSQAHGGEGLLALAHAAADRLLALLGFSDVKRDELGIAQLRFDATFGRQGASCGDSCRRSSIFT
jgi:hypothetical protein